jgi:hypothetical protein
MRGSCNSAGPDDQPSPGGGKTKGDRLEIVLNAVLLSGIADAQRFLTSFWSRSMSFLAYLVP